MGKLTYPSDLSDHEWRVLKPYFLDPPQRGPKRRWCIMSVEIGATNHPENIWVFSSQRAHMMWHHFLWRRDKGVESLFDFEVLLRADGEWWVGESDSGSLNRARPFDVSS